MHLLRRFDRQARHDQAILRALGLILKTVLRMSIDTSKVLAAVAAERTENASLRALLSAHVNLETTLSGQLAAAVAAAVPPTPPVPSADQTATIASLQAHIADLTAQNDTLSKAATSAQADLDQASNDLDADERATAAAIQANQIPAAQQQPTPPPDPALGAVAQANQPQVSTNPAAVQQMQPDGVPFAVANDANPQKGAPDPAVNANAGPGIPASTDPSGASAPGNPNVPPDMPPPNTPAPTPDAAPVQPS